MTTTERLILTTNHGRSKLRIAGSIALASLIALEIYGIASDLSVVRWFRSRNESRPKIAELAKTRNSVRLQWSDALTWEDARQGQDLREGETLLTLDGAQADIAFLGGLGVTLGEDTLVTLETVAAGERGRGSKPPFRLRLHRGSVRTERAPEDLSIEVGGVDLRPAAGAQLSVVRETEAKPGFRIQVGGGAVKAMRGGQEQVIREEESGSWDGERVAVSRSPFSAVLPADHSVLGGSPEDEPVIFQWKVAPSVAGRSQVVEVSSSPEFAVILRDQTIAASEPPMASVRSRFPGILSLDAGRYYWRVRTTSGEKVVSPAFQFAIARPPAPAPYFPAEGAAVDGEVEFIWEAVPGAQGYEFRMGAQKTVEVPAPRHHASVAAPAAWQVRAKVGGDWSAWSPARTLTTRMAEQPSGEAGNKAVAPPPPPAEIDAVIERAPRKKGKDGKR